MFEDNNYESNQQQLAQSSLANTLPYNVSLDTLDEATKRQWSALMPVPVALSVRQEALGLSNDDIGLSMSYSAKGKASEARDRELAKLQQDIQYVSSPERGVPNVTPDLPAQRGMPYLIGTDAAVSAVRDPKNAQEMRKRYTAWSTTQDSIQNVLSDHWDEWVHRNDQQYTKSQAEAYYKTMGLDIKETRDTISFYEMQKKANALVSKQEAEQNYSAFFQTGRLSLLQKADLFATGAMASMIGTPVDLAVTTASIFAPEFIVGAVSKGAGTLSTTYRTGKILNAANKVRTASTAAKVISNTSRVATDSEPIGLLFLNSSKGLKATLDVDSKIVNAARVIEKTKALNYQGLTALEKTGLDVLTWTGIDIPQAVLKKSDADKYGIMNYGTKDAMSEILLSGALGAIVPGTLRFAGKRLGISPFELTERHINDFEIDTRSNMALGNLSQEEGTRQLKEINKLKSFLNDYKTGFKGPNPGIVEAVDELQRTNISSETASYRLQKFIELIRSGIVPKISDLPEYQSIFSHIDARIIGNLLDTTKTVDDVFGSSVTRTLTKQGLTSAKITGETGMLGGKALVALNGKEAGEQLANLYRALILEGVNGASFGTFVSWVNRYQEFYVTLDSILNDYKVRFEANKTGKAYSAGQLINLRAQLEDAYMKYKLLPDEYTNHIKTKAEIRQGEALGEEMDHLRTTDFEAIEKEASDFASSWIVEKKTKSGRTLYDFTNRKGEDDKGARFTAFLNELREGAENNRWLAESNDRFALMEESRIKNWMDKTDKFEISDDTDFGYLFGTPRKSFANVEQLDKDEQSWNIMLNTKSMDREAAMQDEGYRKIDQLLNRYGTEETSSSSVYKVQKRRYDLIDQAKAENYTTLKEKFLTNMRGNETFMKYATAFMGGKSPNNYLKMQIKDVLTETIDSMELSTYITGRTKADLINSVVNSFMSEAKQNPRVLEAFFDYETLAKKYPHITRDTKINVPELESGFKQLEASTKETLGEIDKEAQQALSKGGENLEADLQTLKARRDSTESFIGQALDNARLDMEENKARIKGEAEDIARIQGYMTEFFQPIEKALNIELSRLQVQALYDMDLVNTKLSLMVAHPELASEILISDSTQTMYLFKGAKRNLEYIRRSAPAYVKDIQNTLSRMDKEKGLSLLTYFQTPANRQEISEALINLKHNSARAKEISESLNKMTKGATPENSDAERVASVILDSMTTLQSDMSRYGSTFNADLDVIDPKKMKYIDTLMSENIVKNLQEALRVSTSMNPRQIAGAMTSGSTVRFGDKMVTRAEGLKKATKYIQDIQQDLGALFGISDDMHRGLGLYVFSKLDLDNLYGGERVRIGLNKVRDALLNNRLQELIGDDLYNLSSLHSDIKLLRRKIVGEGGTEVTTDSEVYKFLTGFEDLGSVVDGSRSAFLDKYSRRYRFKDAESEIEAMRTLGYDTLEESLTHNFDTALKAQYSLELFGSSPMNMARDLMLTYSRLCKSDKDFMDRIKALADKNGVSVNKYYLNKADESAIEYAIRSANGLNQQAPNDVTRWVNVLKSFFSTPLLAAAGWKSFSDYGTIMENLVANGLVQGRTQAMASMSRAVKYMATHPKDFRRICIASTIEADKYLKYAMDDPGYNILTSSKNMTLLDRVEAQQRKFSEFFLGKIAHMTPLTDINKANAAWSIQDALGTIRNKSYDDLTKNMGYSLEREGIDAVDWDIYRKYAMLDFNKECGIPEQGEYWVFSPYQIHNIPDEVAASALRAKNKTVNATTIKAYKNELLHKAFVMVDSSADEMISMPSQRITGLLRGKQVQGSMSGALVEIATQYQSFGCALVYNTYGRNIANAVRGQTGVTAIDMFNPFNRVPTQSKIEMGKNIMGAAFTVGVTMLLVDSTVDALRGKIYEPIKEDGSPNVEWLVSKVAAPLGPIGSVLDTALTGLDGSGQKGGGITIQAAPSFSNVIRAGYRIGKPLRSSKVQDKGTAVGAAILNEAARQTGIKTLPYTAIMFQMGFGSYLDELQAGGQDNWSQMMDAREKRGQMVMPWEVAPQPLNFDTGF